MHVEQGPANREALDFLILQLAGQLFQQSQKFAVTGDRLLAARFGKLCDLEGELVQTCQTIHH